MAQTVRSILGRSLRKIGVRAFGENLDADEVFEALQEFNDLVAVLALDGMWRPTVEQISGNLVGGQAEYTFGTDTSDYAARPTELTSIEILTNNVWVVLDQVSADDYAIRNKNVTSGTPNTFTYIQSFPESKVVFTPTPTGNDSVRFNYKDYDKTYGLDDVTGLPREYEAYFVLKLAVKLCPMYAIDVQTASAIATEALNIERRIKKQNAGAITAKPARRSRYFDAKNNTYI